MSGRQDNESPANGEIPEHLRRRPVVYERRGDRVAEAPEEDQAVARRYPAFAEKGSIVDGRRLTILTGKSTYSVNEEVRVIHVFEAPESGEEVYIMGPKPVYGEYVDGVLLTETPPNTDQPWEPELYAGATLSSPAVDYNFEITRYQFSEPGMHEIQWKLGSLESNVLRIEVRQQ